LESSALIILVQVNCAYEIGSGTMKRTVPSQDTSNGHLSKRKLLISC